MTEAMLIALINGGIQITKAIRAEVSTRDAIGVGVQKAMERYKVEQVESAAALENKLVTHIAKKKENVNARQS